MCLIVFAWRPNHAQPLIVAANRDEFYARPSLPLAQWEDAPGVYAGRDQQAGGTWLGVGPNGRFAALTNIRDLRLTRGGPSRGELVAEFLRSAHSPEGYLLALEERANQYAGFNLLVGDSQQLWHFNPHGAGIQQLTAGIYGLSNADLDSPWPKLQRAKSALSQCLAESKPEALLNLLADPQRPDDADLPDTGVGLELERLLSSAFIASPSYGTRACTALIVNQDGSRLMIERRFAEAGAPLDETQLSL